VADDVPVERLPHLELQRTSIAGERRRVRRGYGRPRTHEDFNAHAADLRDRADALSIAHLARRRSAGVDPRLILVFELTGGVEAEEFRRAELRVLDETEGTTVIAFADDPQLRGFRARLDRYAEGIPAESDRASAPYEAFFDSIAKIRPYGPGDRITERLREALSNEGEMRLDVELWHPGDGELARLWVEEVDGAIRELGGRVVDRYVNDVAGYVVLRAYVDAAAVDELANVDAVARLDVLPAMRFNVADLVGLTPDEMPSFEAPGPEAPVVALVDSGVASAHPLLAGAVLDAVALAPELGSAVDESGHGTRIAGLVLHGDIGAILGRDHVDTPPCLVLSIRVLDAQSLFPTEHVWEGQIEEALRYAASRGARVAILAVGDPQTPYVGSRSTPVAGIIDQLARELGLVIVVPTGNVWPGFYSAADMESVDQYAIRLLSDPYSSLIDPAPAAIALTVGGVCTDAAAGGAGGSELAGRIPIGAGGWPSPISRHGPGVGAAIKPELSAAAGSVALDAGIPTFVEDAELKIPSSSVGVPGRLIEADYGTSYAAPIVARVAAAVTQQYPPASANLVRALTLLSAAPSAFLGDLMGETPAARRDAVLHLLGYGEPVMEDAIASTPHRAVLVAEGQIPVDGVQIYDLPIPASFFESGGTRGLAVALAFDPETRIRRLDYQASRMEFHVVRGMTAEEVQDAFLATSGEDVQELEEQGDEEGAADPASLRSHLLTLDPPATMRSRGANQLGRKQFAQRLDQSRHGNSWLLVVKNTNYWATPGTMQQYAVAVAFSRDASHREIYADLEARVRIPIAVEVEIQG